MNRMQHYRNESIIRAENDFFKNQKVDTWDYFEATENRVKKIAEKDKQVSK